MPVGEPDRTLGWAAARWAHQTLIQPNGPRAGESFKLTMDQLRFLLWWYAVDEQGQWLFHHGVRRLAKGSGKSPFAAVLALIEFCGPCRLDRFDDRELGGCRAKPVDMPLVQIAATAESQTANTMRMVRAFAPKDSKLVTEHRIDVGKTQFYKLPEGTLQVITSSATASEGAEASFIVADETEHWKPANGGPELAATLEDNLAKSGERMLETSNSWVPGIESVAEATWDAYQAQTEGRMKDGAGEILYDARIASPAVQLDDYDGMVDELRWVYGDCDWKVGDDGQVDVAPIMKRIWSLRSRPDDARRKYLNQPTADQDAWVAPHEWDQLAAPEVHVADGDEVVLFFDGSKSRDATALIGCRMEDGHVFTLGIWEPDPAHDSTDTVDPVDVDRVVRLAFDRFDIAAFFGDVKEWEAFTTAEWPSRWKDELRLWAVPSGRPPQAIAWDMRSHKDEFAKAVEACHAEIIEGSFTHDGHPALARHVHNARRRPYREMISIGKESPSSPRKIDAAVCMVGARMLRRYAIAMAKPKRSGVVV